MSTPLQAQNVHSIQARFPFIASITTNGYTTPAPIQHILTNLRIADPSATEADAIDVYMNSSPSGVNPLVRISTEILCLVLMDKGVKEITTYLMADFTENQLELLSTWYTTTNHSTPPIIWLYLNDPLKDPLPQEMELLTDQCKSILGPVFQRIAPSKTRIFDRRIAATPREQDIVTEFNAIEEIKFNNNCSEKEAIKILRSAPEKYNLGHTQKYMNTASFISKCKSIHGDKYDYTPTIYVQREAKVKIVCPIHGEFEQRARNHMDGSGCVKCSYIKPTRITRPPVVKADVREPNSRNQTALASFIKRSTILHNGYYTYDNAEWGGYHAATTIHCPVHGDFYQRIGSHLKGFGCSKCAYDKRRKIEPTNDVG